VSSKSSFVYAADDASGGASSAAVSPQTMFITGQVLIIDGGRSVGLSGT
jgi:hypothetical protein